MTTVLTTEDYKTAQEERIARSKIYGDGTTPIPQGIVDILFIDSESGIISKYTGTEKVKGRILILLPFRTPRNLTKFASYAQPSEWTLNFQKGTMVNAIIENGYVKKLILSHRFMPSAKVIDPASLQSESFNELTNPLVPAEDFPLNKVDLASTQNQKVAAIGFEVDEENPF